MLALSTCPEHDTSSDNYWPGDRALNWPENCIALGRGDFLLAILQSLLDTTFSLVPHLQKDNVFLRLRKVRILQGPSHYLWGEVPQGVTQDRQLGSQA